MPESVDVVVVGGGVVGVAAAYYLAERGRGVVLLERGEVGSGASYGNAGLLLPSHSVPLAAPGVLGQGLRWMLDPESPFYLRPRLDPALLHWLWRFARSCTPSHVRRALPVLRDLHRASLALYRELVTLHRLACGFEERGLLVLYRTPEGLEAGSREMEALAEHGIAGEVVAGSGLMEREPSVLPDLAGGVFYPEDAHVTPGEFVAALARTAQGLGVEIRSGAEVTGFRCAAGRVEGVRTVRGELRVREVVLAAGAWSPGVARSLGLRLPVQPAKGYSLTLLDPPSLPRIPLLLGEARVGVTPMGGLLRLAGTLELSGHDLAINRRRVEAIRRGAAGYLSGIEGVHVLETWAGLRPCTPDGLPILGRSPRHANLTLALGHCTIGQSLGPISGRLAAQVVCGEQPDLDLAPLSLSRFR